MTVTAVECIGFSLGVVVYPQGCCSEVLEEELSNYALLQR